MAASSATTTRSHPALPNASQVRQGYEEAIEKIVIDWVAASADGSFADYVITGGPVIGILLRMVTNPGATAPTAAYDITIVDEDGFDVLGGTGANRDASNTEEAVPAMGTYFQRPVANTLTLKIGGNSVHSATGSIALYLKK